VEEVVLRWKELLFSSTADVEVLSVDVNVETVCADARCSCCGRSGRSVVS
jgi:hypothetical protein